MLILYGINDVHQGYGVERIADSISKMVSICQASNVMPILMTYPPQCGGRFEIFAGKTRRLNAQLRTMAAAKGIKCVDLEESIGGQSRYYESDGLHPNNAGTQAIAREVAKAFWAYWPLKYPVLLNARGGSNGTVKVSAVFGKMLPAAKAPVLRGYNFQGFYTAATGGTQYYTATMKPVYLWDKKTTMTLYAHWMPKKSKITFKANGGKLTTTNVTATFGKALPAAKAPTRTGYKFLGYYNSKGTCFYDATMTPMKPKWVWAGTAYTFYAHWEAKKASVTMHPNGGAVGTPKVTVTYGKALPKITPPKRAGYTLLGMYNARSGGAKYWTASGTGARNWNGTKTSYTFYAHWSPKNYAVTLSRNGGSNGTSKVTATFAKAMPAATAPVRKYYIFKGYYDATSGGTQYYTAAMKSARTWNKASSATLYARWQGQAATITIKGNGGSNGTATATARFGSAMPRITVPVRKGYRCLGIYNKSSGGTRYWNADGTGARAWNGTQKDYTFYAHWERLPKVVGVLTNDGTDGWAAVDGDTDTVWHGAADRTAWTLTLTYDLPKSMTNLELSAEEATAGTWGASTAADSAAVDDGDWEDVDFGDLPFDEPRVFQYLHLWFEDDDGVPPAVREVVIE